MGVDQNLPSVPKNHMPIRWENPPHFMGFCHMVSGVNFPSTNPLSRNHCGKIFLALLFPARWSTSDAVLSQKTGPASHAGMESGQKRSQPLSHQPRGRGLSKRIKEIISKNHEMGTGNPVSIMGRPVVHHPTKTEALGDFSKLSRLESQIPLKKYQ